MGAVFNRVTLSATGDTQIAWAGANAGEAGWQLTFAGTGWTGSVVLKQNTAPPGAAASLSTVSYFNATTGALVAAGTAITSAISVIVSNTGLDLWLVYTHTAGSVQVTAMAGAGQFGGVTVAAGDIAAGTFGAYSGATGTYAFPGLVTGAFNGTIGATTPAAASFTTLAASSTAAITGNLTVGASTFVVTAATGNVLSTGTLFQFGDQVATTTIVTLGKRSAGDNDTRLQFIGSSSATNWQVSCNDGVSGNFRITPSTVVGGNTFTTPALQITSAGAATFGGALAITGALTGVTTAATSGVVGIGTATSASSALNLGGDILTGTTQYGVYGNSTLSGTTESSLLVLNGTVKASTTATIFAGIHIYNPDMGGGAAVTTQYGILIEDMTRGTTKYAIKCNGGRVALSLPTSSAGLAAGDLWANSGVVTVA